MERLAAKASHKRASGQNKQLAHSEASLVPKQELMHSMPFVRVCNKDLEDVKGLSKMGPYLSRCGSG